MLSRSSVIDRTKENLTNYYDVTVRDFNSGIIKAGTEGKLFWYPVVAKGYYLNPRIRRLFIQELNINNYELIYTKEEMTEEERRWAASDLPEVYSAMEKGERLAYPLVKVPIGKFP